eukprot:52690-Pyramimonas_sp.AAC.1
MYHGAVSRTLSMATPSSSFLGVAASGRGCGGRDLSSVSKVWDQDGGRGSLPHAPWARGSLAALLGSRLARVSSVALGKSCVACAEFSVLWDSAQ